MDFGMPLGADYCCKKAITPVIRVTGEMAILQQLSVKDAVKNVDCKNCEDCSDDLNPQSIPFGQHFAATVPRFHKAVGIKHVSDTVSSKENEKSASKNLFPKTVVEHSP
jgi:hypothetical protein